MARLLLLVLLGWVMASEAAEASSCRGVPQRALADFDLAGPHPVGVRTFTYVDESRPTPPNGSFPGAPSRTLPTEVWYPASEAGRDAPVAAGAHPLVIYSHGGLGSRLEASYVGPHLASHGIIVAAPEFPLSRLGAPGGVTADDVPNQPGDVRFVIDRVLADFGAAADAARVGVTGHSLGGVTTLLVTFHRELRDARIRASLPMAPSGCFLTRRFFKGVRTPLLILHGDSDQLATFKREARPAYVNANPPRYLVRLEKGSHLGFTPLAVNLDPTMHLDAPVCPVITQTFGTNDPVVGFAFLHDPEAGIRVTSRRCPLLCTQELPDSSMSAARQHQLTRVTLAAFFQAYLLGDDAAHCFLRRGLRREPDVGVRSAGTAAPVS